MILINYKQDNNKTFKQAVLKGMAAPVMIYGSFQIQKLSNVINIESNTVDPKLAISGDWRAVKSDLNAAIIKYGQTKKK